MDAAVYELEIMRAALALFVLAACTVSALAGEIRAGATMQVKPNSIWFEEAAQLAKWQRIQKSRRAASLVAYQKRVLGRREAWQFINPLTVKILGYEPAKRRVHVEMQTEGRLQNSTWFLDVDALAER